MLKRGSNYLSTAQRVAKILLEIKAITFSPKKPYKFVSGLLSPIYTDNRLLMGYPLKRKEITIYMATLLREKNLYPEIIAGTATAGIPPAAWLAELLSLPMIYVRLEKKDHGKGNQVEGVFKRGTNILLVEDLISTGQSSLSAIEAIRKLGGKISSCVAYFDYGLRESRKAYRKKKVKLFTLTSFKTLTEMGQKMHLLNRRGAKMLFAWQKDPWGWGEKR